MKYQWMKKLPALALLLGFALGGCGGGAAEPPEAYGIDEDSLPALGMVGRPGTEGTTFTAEEAEEGESATYVYGGLSDGGAEAKIYVNALTTDYGCSIIDESGTVLSEPVDFSVEEGSVLIGKNTEAGDGIFQVSLQWTAESCTVSVSVAEGLQVTQPQEEMPLGTALTTQEAVESIESLSPQTLGLDGASMEGYFVYAQDGYVMVDGQACYLMNVYDEDHAIRESCLLSLDGQKLYLLDRETGQVRPVS